MTWVPQPNEIVVAHFYRGSTGRRMYEFVQVVEVIPCLDKIIDVRYRMLGGSLVGEVARCPSWCFAPATMTWAHRWRMLRGNLWWRCIAEPAILRRHKRSSWAHWWWYKSVWREIKVAVLAPSVGGFIAERREHSVPLLPTRPPPSSSSSSLPRRKIVL